MPHGSYEPLYTADEMRAAETRYPGYPGSAPELTSTHWAPRWFISLIA